MMIDSELPEAEKRGMEYVHFVDSVCALLRWLECRDEEEGEENTFVYGGYENGPLLVALCCFCFVLLAINSEHGGS